MKNTTPLEREEHRVLASALRRAGLFWIHVPNEGKRSARQGYALKMMGMAPGCPDFLIFTRPPVAIEMKRQKGGRVSEAQREFMQQLAGEGWRCFVTYGAEAAFKALGESGHKVGEYNEKAKHRYDEIKDVDAATED